jgi:hypothetical protein
MVEHTTIVRPQLIRLSEINKKGIRVSKNVWRVKVIDEVSQVLEKYDFEHNEQSKAIDCYMKLKTQQKSKK